MTSNSAPTPTTKRRGLGIRPRIVLGYVVLLAAALGVSIILTRQVLLIRLDRQVDRALAQEIEELRTLAGGTNPMTGEPFGDDAAAILDTFLRRSVPADHESFYTMVDGERFLSSFDAPQIIWDDDELVDVWRSIDAPTRGEATTALGDIDYLAVPLESDGEVAGVFTIVYWPESEREDVLVVIRTLLVAGAVVLLATAAIAWSIAGRVLRPVRDLTATARRISDVDLSQRIEVEGNDELAELGDTFNDMIDRLEASFEHEREFLDSVAHELRTPITIVQGHLDLLATDPDGFDDGVAVMTDELDRMNRYVSDLLLLAKAESGEFLHIEPVDIGELGDTLDQRARAIADRDWVIENSLRPGSVAILGDRDRLVQAALNLITNAVQHTEPGDQITVGIDADQADNRVRIWVRDSGSGIEAPALEQLFERRFRGAESRARRADGMGIGLSIVDTVARGHGGSARAEDVPDGGAKFTIDLPIDPQPEENP